MYNSILLAADGSKNSIRAAQELLNFIGDYTHELEMMWAGMLALIKFIAENEVMESPLDHTSRVLGVHFLVFFPTSVDWSNPT